ncbi:TolB family protein [Streptomyces sp. NPDC059467]|uniref:TolB family protein n=1 Tax=Streptomyces sp. NPDC059467 TaxID=3346844 RepID=UPI0036893FB2
MSMPVAVALGLAVSSGLGTTAATASHHIRNGQIATDYGAEAIYLQTTDPVTGATSDIGAPDRTRGCNLAASQDGKTLAYSTVCGYFAGRGGDTVSVMNRDGTGQRVVWQMPSDFGSRQSVVGNPAISPDGKRILFGTARTTGPSQTSYWTINTDGTGLAPLDLGVSTAPDGVPRFSPDGRTLAFTVGGVIWLKKGNKPAAPLTVRKPGLPNNPYGWLRWSPDGRHLVFADGKGLYEVAAHGSAWRALAASPSSTTGYFEPAYSPDGTQIAFISITPSGDRGGDLLRSIAGLNLARPGTPRTILPGNPAYEVADPVWLPAQ